MAILLKDIIEEVMLNLEGYIADQDVYGTLTNAITDTQTTFTLSGASNPDGSGFSAGIVEIGTELVYIQNFDRLTGVASGVLRGFRGTTATAHAQYSGVRNNPRFPRIVVKRAINDVITNLHPRIMAVKKTELTISRAVKQYDLPADVIDVLSVQHETVGPSKLWIPSRQWRFDATGGSNGLTGKTIDIIDSAAKLRSQIVYAAQPPALDYNDDYSLTGLPDWARDIIVYGACWRLTSFMDTQRTVVNSADQALMNSPSYGITQAQGAGNSKFFLAIYTQRLAEGEARQRLEYPAQKHYLS